MDMCHYHQTSPESVFTQQRLVTIATFEGRVTQTGMRLSITNGAEIHESVVNSEGEYDEILEQNFKIKNGVTT